MLNREAKAATNEFFRRLSLQDQENRAGKDKAAKIEQILAYLEIIHAHLRKYSRKRRLVCIESGAGNCYLSFLVYYFYTKIEPRPITIHCLDTNDRLMAKARSRAREFSFEHMHFHACDIADYASPDRISMVYSLHACDSATDKALYLGVRHNAPCILSVACCQHKLRQQLRGHPYAAITRHRVFKDRVVYMVGDALRALLLEMRGYKVDILEFTSSRHTDKNTMIRARRGNGGDVDALRVEYSRLRDAFRVVPSLERYLAEEIY